MKKTKLTKKTEEKKNQKGHKMAKNVKSSKFSPKKNRDIFIRSTDFLKKNLLPVRFFFFFETSGKTQHTINKKSVLLRLS